MIPQPSREGIAIIGVAGRFPGAPDVATFWENICSGVESISSLADRPLADAFDAATRSAPNFVRARGLLADVDRFDAAFFGMHAREAEATDPQHRVMLETAWEALEDAGCDPTRYPGVIGIYAGCSISTYLLRHVLRDRAAVETFASEYQVGSFPALLGGGADFLATRIAYKLNLRGPAMTVQSACSTGLLAVAQACQALRQGQADVMLAGAAAISFPQERGYLHLDGGMVSADGHCRTFDAAASGTVFGAGVGAVVLKRHHDALADGDAIYAVIRGVGVSNDGSAKIGYSAPSVEGQVTAIRAAHRDADVDPATIGYVECHGTATPLGDPIEVAALAKAFAASTEPSGSCVLGSVKPNIGHLDHAAGMAGIIKTALAVRDAVIPGTLHFSSLNPRIELGGTPFRIRPDTAPWPADDAQRRAGVSAFGVGGTNVHLVLEADAPREVRESHGPQLLVLSARTERALDDARLRLAAHLRAHPGLDLADVAATLQTGRREFPKRFSSAVTSTAAAIEALENAPPAAFGTAGSAGDVAFLFPGQGAQFAGMGRALYDCEPVFREAVDACASIVNPHLGTDVRALLYPATCDQAAERALTATSVAQPAIFTISYALARLWMSRGIEPVAMLGHSVGEFVAATLCGVFSLADALRVVTERGRLMQAMAPGAMLAVRLSEDDLAPFVREPLGIAALNAPRQAVVAGPFEDIAALEASLDAAGAMHKRVATSHAFHSPMMDPIREPLLALLETIPLAAPSRPYVSTLTGRWIDDADAVSPVYWADHARATVRFAEALATLEATFGGVLLEVGPGTALASSARQGARRETPRTIVSSLPASDAGTGADLAMLDALGRVWRGGARPSWDALRPSSSARRTSLPTYSFESTRYWIEAATGGEATSSENPVPQLPQSPAANTTQSVRSDVERDLCALLAELSGEPIASADIATTFLELGFDSLFLGRFVQRVQQQFGVDVTFRQLLGALPSISALAGHIVAVAPPAPKATAPAAALAMPTPASGPAPASGATAAYEALVRQQLAAMQDLMREQLQALGAAQGAIPAQPPASPPATPVAASPSAEARFDAFRIRGAHVSNELTGAQRAHIDALVARVASKTASSKTYTQRYRPVLADPRIAAGFRSEWKEMVYAIVCARAKGSRLWDLDGNEYIDILNGFGQTAFGHAPDFVVEAVRAQLDRGFAIGPQADTVGEVAELFCKLTGNDRVTFCNTGSEAVMAALRVARTVTGRDRVVIFSGAYHGQFDEVLVKGARTSERSIPVAPGIPAGSVTNITVLENASDESLAWVRAHAHELAAVVVEPVQSRHPSLQPREFVAELRAITQSSGAALVFDEVVTGFRMHPGGMQAVFGVRADLATYGKVVGGGMPIGVLAGSARFMDALDGGMWQYGDDSVPEVPPTFLAGTFVRHPLVMAALLAVLRHLDGVGPELQEAMTRRTRSLVERLNAGLERRGIASRIETFGSMFYFNFTQEERLASLLYYHLRDRGIYIQEGFPCFLTTAHTDADVDAIVRAFDESFDELNGAGIFAGAAPGAATGTDQVAASNPDVPLTEEQNEIWLVAQLGDDASRSFNESITLNMNGELDETVFAECWNEIFARHDALRTVFGPTGEAMRVLPDVAMPYAYTDLSARSATDAQVELEQAIVDDGAIPFDLSVGPLVRGHLLRMPAGRYAFIFTVHHIICDGWSMNVILDEFKELYSARRDGRPHVLREPLSFVASARARLERAPADADDIERFWLAQFAQPAPQLDLPLDRPRPAIKSYTGATVSRSVDRQHYAAIKAAGAKDGCTLFVVLLASYQALLGRLAKVSDVVVGIPAAGQALLDVGTLVGHCVNFLPIRGRWNGDTSVSELLRETRDRVLDAYDHQDYTFGTLVRKLDPARETNRLPLTEFQFNLERLDDDLSFAGLTGTVVPNPKAFVNFDLFLNVIESDAGLRLDCDFNTKLFDRETIVRWLDAYLEILDAAVRDAGARVDAITLDQIDVPPVPAIVAGPARTYPDVSIPALIEAQVRARPDACAVVFEGTRVTYAELDRRANRLARHIAANAGAGTRVAIGISRSIDMLVALYATLKAGYSYVPLDPSHPAARLLTILGQAEVAALVIDATANAELATAGIPIIHVERDAQAIATHSDEPLAPLADTDAAAYLLYTSGSTGAPKGVEVSHRSAVNFLLSAAETPGFTADDVLIAVSTIAFDIAALELYLPLSVGGTVAIASASEVVDGTLLRELIEREHATIFQATPATWRLLIEAGFRAPSGFRMLCTGEAMPRTVADRLLDSDGELWNMYGPTETTIWSTCAHIRRGDAINVGKPVANTTCYVLDDADQCVAKGVVGQLHIGGSGVSAGYPYLAELTAERFIPDPFHGGRMYRTGDAARMREDGTIEVLGRADDQIKLRGFRIELGEIETALVRAANLNAAAVTLRDADTESPRLVAYLVPRGGAPIDEDEMRTALRRQLPDYMIPTAWVTLDAMPLSSNGKLDRKALPAPPAAPARPKSTVPMTALERDLAAIWSEVLGRPDIDAADDIFALGADSIQIFAITARANRRGLRVLAKDILQKRTIANVARSLDDVRVGAGRRLSKPPVSRHMTPTPQARLPWK